MSWASGHAEVISISVFKIQLILREMSWTSRHVEVFLISVFKNQLILREVSWASVHMLRYFQFLSLKKKINSYCERWVELQITHWGIFSIYIFQKNNAHCEMWVEPRVTRRGIFKICFSNSVFKNQLILREVSQLILREVSWALAHVLSYFQFLFFFKKIQLILREVSWDSGHAEVISISVVKKNQLILLEMS